MIRQFPVPCVNFIIPDTIPNTPPAIQFKPLTAPGNIPEHSPAQGAALILRGKKTVKITGFCFKIWPTFLLPSIPLQPKLCKHFYLALTLFYGLP